MTISVYDSVAGIKSKWQNLFIYISEHVKYTITELEKTEIEEIFLLSKTVDAIVEKKKQQQKEKTDDKYERRFRLKDRG